mgnify:CR=1 FL=1
MTDVHDKTETAKHIEHIDRGVCVLCMCRKKKKKKRSR